MKYEITSKPFPVVIFNLERGESIYCEAGAMSWMTDNFKFDTQAGSIGKAFSRAFSGENMFVNKYTATNDINEIAMASKFLGTILPIEISEDKSIICQKHAILAYTENVDRKIAFQKPMKGLFGGEGFIMQKIFGNGMCFLEVDGETREFDLREGETMLIDTGYLLLMESSVTLDLKSVGGVKNTLFGGEGIFNTSVTGPGKIVVQTSPIYKLANSIRPFMVTGN